MTLSLRLGFLPLLDAALLVAARDEGFAEAEGLHLELVRDVSWSNLRDKLHVRLLDAAHMLAPAAIASTLGIGSFRAPMATPLALNLNGNAITLSVRRYEELARLAEGSMTDPAVSAQALAKVVAIRKGTGLPPLTLATVFGHSTHTYILRRWLALGGLVLGQDVLLEIVSPVQSVDALTSGRVDGFCAGAPWNTLAVKAGIGAIVHLGLDLWPDAPEKVLALRADDVETRHEAVGKLVRALAAASEWASLPANMPMLARHLAQPAVLGQPEELVASLLAGQLDLGAGRGVRAAPGYLRLDSAAIAPNPAHGRQILGEMAALGLLQPSEDQFTMAESIYRLDLFTAAARI
ncbi:MAG: CmpA/NrtA family ABC transporter substrate-binding protein [Bosea sp. (in: a-proteobacteria)]